MASLVNLSPSKMYFTTKSEKELTLTTLYSVTLNFYRTYLFPILCPAPYQTSNTGVQQRKFCLKRKALSRLWSLCGEHPCTPVELLRGAVSCLTRFAQLQLFTKMKHTQYRLHFSSQVVSPPTRRLPYGTAPRLSRHKISRGALSPRQTQKDTYSTDG